MRLMTTIEARRDGTVRVRSSAGEAFVFQADGAGALVCEIADSALIGYFLNGVFTWLYRIPSYNPNTSQQLVCVAHFTPPAYTLITLAGGAASGAYYDIILLAMGVMR